MVSYCSYDCQELVKQHHKLGCIRPYEDNRKWTLVQPCWTKHVDSIQRIVNELVNVLDSQLRDVLSLIAEYASVFIYTRPASNDDFDRTRCIQWTGMFTSGISYADVQQEQQLKLRFCPAYVDFFDAIQTLPDTRTAKHVRARKTVIDDWQTSSNVCDASQLPKNHKVFMANCVYESSSRQFCYDHDMPWVAHRWPSRLYINQRTPGRHDMDEVYRIVYCWAYTLSGTTRSEIRFGHPNDPTLAQLVRLIMGSSDRYDWLLVNQNAAWKVWRFLPEFACSIRRELDLVTELTARCPVLFDDS